MSFGRQGGLDPLGSEFVPAVVGGEVEILADEYHGDLACGKTSAESEKQKSLRLSGGETNVESQSSGVVMWRYQLWDLDVEGNQQGVAADYYGGQAGVSMKEAFEVDGRQFVALDPRQMVSEYECFWESVHRSCGGHDGLLVMGE